MCTRGDSLADGAAHDRAHETRSRRQFLRGLALGVGGTVLGLNGVPVRASGSERLLRAMGASDPDRVLVLIQLAGGNDGLNTIVPYANDLYYQARPRISIRDTEVVKLTSEIGLHPSLSPWEPFYQDGQLGIVQNVGYQPAELSHFVSTDVWLSADEAGDQSGTGWLGRYLEGAYPDYLTNPPERPLAMQIGSASPLLFQTGGGSLGVNFPSLSQLNRLTDGDGIFDEQGVPQTLLGEQLAFVRRVSNDSFTYAEAIRDSHVAGSNQSNYSGDTLSRNLATVARLIRGGLGARIYHVSMGGFDTHANQAGGHSVLLRRLAEATTSFMNDLAQDGLGDRVMAMTFSEFGRRIRENSSSGTDHGTAAPLFVFGGGVAGGLIGNGPNLGDLDPNGNLKVDIDFRSVYGSVLRNWLRVDDAAVAGLLGAAYPDPGLFGVGTNSGASAAGLPGGFAIDAAYPNPASGQLTVELAIPQTGQVRVEVLDLLGRRVATLADRQLSAGSQLLGLQLPGRMSAGAYLLQVTTGGRTATRGLAVIR